MSLESVVEGHLGSILEVRCQYGWGWSKKGAGTVEVPPPFQMKLNELWAQGEDIRGGIGEIVGSHPYSGKTVIFSTRHVGTFNFDTKIATYNISIGDSVRGYSERGWPLLRNRINDDGFGEIGLPGCV